MQMISIIIPVYNSSKFLDMCLKSVINQTYSNLEIILIDDGSNDDSGYICDKYAAYDNRIRVIHQGNKGVSNARNAGLKLASGELISFLDSDDQLELDMLSFLVDILLKYDADISHCGYKRVDENMRVLNEVSGTHRILVQNNTDAIDCMLKGINFSGGLWNKLFKSEVLENLTFCEELKNNEDILFNVQAFSRADKIVFADETKYKYFEHPFSACNQINVLRQLEDSIIASEKMLEIKNEEIKKSVISHLFDCLMNLYRFLLLNSEHECDNKMVRIRLKLVETYNMINDKSLRGKINYNFLMHIPRIYCFVYKLYNSIRKPKWDPNKRGR